MILIWKEKINGKKVFYNLKAYSLKAYSLKAYSLKAYISNK